MSKTHTAFAAAISLAIFALMAFVTWNTEPWQASGSGADDLDALVAGIFTAEGHVVALEVLGVLLTAAMIGSLVIARPLGGTSDDRHYATVSDAVIAESQELSEIDATWPAAMPLNLEEEE